MRSFSILLALVATITILLACGGDSGQQETVTADSGMARAEQFEEAMDTIIAILERNDYKAIYARFVKPSEIEKIKAAPGGLDSAYVKFQQFIPPLLQVLKDATTNPPQYNADTTYAVYDPESAPAPVNFEYINGRWYFSPKG